MFLACTFVSTSKTFANPFDSWLFRSVRFRGRTGATSTPGTRFPLHSSTLRILSRSPLPSRPSFEDPSDQSVRPVPNPEARLTRRPIVPCSPPLPLAIPLRISARNSLRLSLTYRSARIDQGTTTPWGPATKASRTRPTKVPTSTTRQCDQAPSRYRLRATEIGYSHAAQVSPAEAEGL
jgi:hypothetical protein